MKEYYYQDNKFIIENYHKKGTFSSFLPGISGKMGIPLWAFYVNRGQGITSFGVMDKSKPILEFFPANKAYQNVNKIGFRTFIKLNDEVYEFFTPTSENTKMIISKDSFSIEEVNKEINIKVIVTYFGLPNENIAALVRKVEIINLDNYNREIEVVDGLSQILPYGVSNGEYKEISNLLQSWMEVEELENNFAFYKMRSSTSDEAEMKEVVSGNFYVSYVDGKIKCPIVDNDLIFGYDASLTYPMEFMNHSIMEIDEQKQIYSNKVPAGYTTLQHSFDKEESVSIVSYIGMAHTKALLFEFIQRTNSKNYYNLKKYESSHEIDKLLDNIYTKTNYPIFDEYLKQSYLDNIIRGGFPVLFGNKDKFVYYLFSRKHGDLERDYNYFSLLPEFYSQGNGNFRDVCQNRRNDSLIVPEISDYNIRVFASLIQIDGYNPLSVNGSTFIVTDFDKLGNIIENSFSSNQDLIKNTLTKPFTPGGFINMIENHNVKVNKHPNEILNDIIDISEQRIEASFGEGYWVDHWTYILDLIKNYLIIYPEKYKELMFKEKSYLIYQSPATVLPRELKTVTTHSGEVRQYGSVIHLDDEKIKICRMDTKTSNWHKTNQHKIYKMNLFNKLLLLIINKFSSLDPYGIGVSMEADKPGWNDAMNGLPGLFGSGVSETVELKRMIQFVTQHKLDINHIKVQEQVLNFVKDVHKILKTERDEFYYWDTVNNIKEKFRDETRYFIEDKDTDIEYKDLIKILLDFEHKLDESIEKAKKIGNGIIPTFLTYEVTKHTPYTKDGEPIIGQYGLPLTKAKEFKVNPIAPFLEAPARLLKITKDKDYAKELYGNIKHSDIYDSFNQMYKTSGNLDEFSLEIGRIRAFTKGWLEREANFLHMTYKYLLGLLKSGLYDEFFEDLFHNFVCFMNPEKYGRPTTENSSFIAPDVNPNPFIQGKGYMARLSGSTAEVISIIFNMMMGDKPFIYENNILKFMPKPILHSSMFDKENTVEFKFLGNTVIRYINESGHNTYDPNVSIYKITLVGETDFEFEKDYITGQYAEMIRLGKYKRINIFIKNKKEEKYV